MFTLQESWAIFPAAGFDLLSVSDMAALAGRAQRRAWQVVWHTLFQPCCSAPGQHCVPNLKRLGGFYTGPTLSICVVQPPPRLICECAECQCTRPPNHREVFCFSTGYTCPKSRVPACCRLWFVLLLKDCTLQINQRVQLCALRISSCRKVTKLIFVSSGGRGQSHKIIFPSEGAFSTST